MAGAGGLVALLLDVEGPTGQYIVVAVVGVLMIAYVLIGGMKGTTWVQIVKAVLLIARAGIMTLWVLGIYGLNFSELLGASVQQAASEGVQNAEALLNPGKQYGPTTMKHVDFISLRSPSCSVPRACRTC